MNSTVDDGLPWLYGDFSALKLSRSDGVLSINLCNPPLNAMTDEIHTELAAIFPIIDRDEHSRIVVFTGSGERAFCAGGDFEQMLSGMGDVSGWLHKMQQARSIVIGMLECRKPIIGRINGHAIGLGASLALCCDVTVMVDDAKIGDPHVSVGLTAGDGGALLWPALLGNVAAKRYLLSGEAISGQQAMAIGLVTEAVERASLDTAIAAWTTRLSASAPIAVQTTKKAINYPLLAMARSIMDEHLRLETEAWASPDHREAVLALRDKRTPQFLHG